eukprot:361140-Chlamydomonas_euryale.AAC.5
MTRGRKRACAGGTHTRKCGEFTISCGRRSQPLACCRPSRPHGARRGRQRGEGRGGRQAPIGACSHAVAFQNVPHLQLFSDRLCTGTGGTGVGAGSTVARERSLTSSFAPSLSQLRAIPNNWVCDGTWRPVATCHILHELELAACVSVCAFISRRRPVSASRPSTPHPLRHAAWHSRRRR